MAWAALTWASRDVEIFLPGLGLEFVEKRRGSLGLGLQLLGGGPLNGIVNQHQRVAAVHGLAFGDENLLHRSGNFRIDVDILAAGLIAFDDALGVDALGVGIRSGSEYRWLAGFSMLNT